MPIEDRSRAAQPIQALELATALGLKVAYAAPRLNPGNRSPARSTWYPVSEVLAAPPAVPVTMPDVVATRGLATPPRRCIRPDTPSFQPASMSVSTRAVQISRLPAASLRQSASSKLNPPQLPLAFKPEATAADGAKMSAFVGSNSRPYPDQPTPAPRV